jgi:two-component system response regulator RegA
LLIVEDEGTIRHALSLFFASNGYQVDSADEKGRAELLIAQHHYDVILADLRLGGSSDVAGLEIASFAHERSPATKIILLTAYGSPEIEQEARQRGVDAFLHKPQPLTSIASTILSLLQSA